jgi:hypothetical protein
MEMDGAANNSSSVPLDSMITTIDLTESTPPKRTKRRLGDSFHDDDEHYASDDDISYPPQSQKKRISDSSIVSRTRTICAFCCLPCSGNSYFNILKIDDDNGLSYYSATLDDGRRIELEPRSNALRNGIVLPSFMFMCYLCARLDRAVVCSHSFVYLFVLEHLLTKYPFHLIICF